MDCAQLGIQAAQNTISKQVNALDVNKVIELSITNANTKISIVNLSAQRVIVKIANVYTFWIHWSNVKLKIHNVNNMLMDTVQNVNHFSIISTVYVSKTVKVVLFKHRLISVKNVKRVTDSTIQANVSNLSTNLIGTPLIWTFSLRQTQTPKKNLNKFSHPVSWIRSIFSLVSDQIMESFSTHQTSKLLSQFILKLMEKDGNQRLNLINTLVSKSKKCKYFMPLISNVWLTIKWLHLSLNILIVIFQLLSKKLIPMI